MALADVSCQTSAAGRFVKLAMLMVAGVVPDNCLLITVPVVAAIVGVGLPVVARRVVAAIAVKRAVQVVQLSGRRVCHAVDVGIDGTAVG